MHRLGTGVHSQLILEAMRRHLPAQHSEGWQIDQPGLRKRKTGLSLPAEDGVRERCEAGEASTE